MGGYYKLRSLIYQALNQSQHSHLSARRQCGLWLVQYIKTFPEKSVLHFGHKTFSVRLLVQGFPVISCDSVPFPVREIHQNEIFRVLFCETTPHRRYYKKRRGVFANCLQLANHTSDTSLPIKGKSPNGLPAEVMTGRLFYLLQPKR